MAVKIRMKRTGGKNDASFRVVAADARSPRDGKNLETLGWYKPTCKDKMFDLNMERIEYWVSVGAQVSDTVASLMRKTRKAAAAAASAVPVVATADAN